MYKSILKYIGLSLEQIDIGNKISLYEITISHKEENIAVSQNMQFSNLVK